MKNNKNKFILVILIAGFFSLINYLCYPLIIDTLYQEIEVPVVKRTLKEETVIKQDDIEIIKMKGSYFQNDIELDISSIVGKIVKDGYVICKGMPIPKESITEANEEYNGNAQQRYLYLCEIDSDLLLNEYIFEGAYIDLYFYMNESIGETKRVSGLLVEQCEVIEITDNADGVVLLLELEEFDYCIRAQKIGQLLPLISNNTTNGEYYDVTYFNTDMTKSYIDKYSNSLRYETVPN